jgi:hypothetical protein
MIIDVEVLSTFILALFSAGIGGLISFYFASKSKKQEAIMKFREEKYSNLIIFLQGFVGNTSNSETKRKFFEEQYKSWTYSSDEVVKALNNLVEIVKNNGSQKPNIEEGQKAIGNIVLAMRKDLLGKTSLTYNDFKYTDVIER